MFSADSLVLTFPHVCSFVLCVCVCGCVFFQGRVTDYRSHGLVETQKSRPKQILLSAQNHTKHTTPIAKIRLKGSFSTINLPWWKGPVEADADVEVAMVTTAEGRAFPEEVRDLRPPLCPTAWPPLLLFLFFSSTTAFPVSALKVSLELLPERVDDTSWKLALVKRAAPSSSRFCEEAGMVGTPLPVPLLL